MNCVELFFQRQKETPEKLALWLPGGIQASYSELADIGVRTQALMTRYGLKAGDTVLVFEGLGPRLYGAIIGLMSMGVGIALVEPWMPVEKINHVLPFVKPKAFLSSPVGFAWGLRVAAIRAIPNWIRTTEIARERSQSHEIVQVDGDMPGIITFTSGTTGNPKGMVRTHRYLSDQHRIFVDALHSEAHSGSDLCIFANFVLANLASGRTSVVIPPGWKTSHFAAVSQLPKALQPETVTCGPAFLLKMLKKAYLPELKVAHVGGALTDCLIFERAFKKWPGTEWHHLYGSTEVEPVAVADARESVKKSRAAGFFQTLYLGNPIPQIDFRLEEDTVWVTGPHVCPRYLANEEENQKYKKTDERGRVWHRMGDRVRVRDGGWWYQGRESQPESDFLVEQKMYSVIQSSAAFMVRPASGQPMIYCQKARTRRPLITAHFPEVSEVVATKIRRDRRHRARIDRAKSTRPSLWNSLVG